MNVKPGTYNLGPSDGAVRVKTGRQGMAAKVGQDLTLEGCNWKATVTSDAGRARSEVRAATGPRTPDVTAAAGGAKPVSDKDKKDIKKNSSGLLGNESITYTTTSVEPRSEAGVKTAGIVS